MSEKKLIRKQIIKNMIMNFITFTIIFSLFASIIYTKIQSSLYKSSDAELLDSGNRKGITRKISLLENQLSDDKIETNLPPIDNINSPLTSDKKPKGEIKSTWGYSDNDDVNPRLTYIVRNSSGEIILENEATEEFQDFGLDASNLDSVTPLKLDNSYSYRFINFQITVNDEDYDIQFFINVDAEEEMVTDLKITLIVVTIACIFISLIISYILSKKTLKPIIFAWNKQIEFVQNASHELRTPLTIIQTKEELLLDEPESKIIDNFEDIKITINETKRLSTLVKELMELARADSNRMNVEKEPIIIDDLITEVIEPFKDIAESQNKTLNLDLNFKYPINLDKDKIHELLVIIIDNSLKYTKPEDSITIRTAKRDTKKVTITIEDTGIGISDEALPHIFERFYREDKARSRKSGGNGLGLSIAKTIVDAHKGTINAYHNKPEGTIIEIKLKN